MTCCSVNTPWCCFRTIDPALDRDVQIISSSPVVEAELAKYKDVIGKDLPGYRNHIYRVLTYTNHFLGGDQAFRNVVELALVYHDLGLWTHGDLAYLDPSIALAKETLVGTLNAEELQLLHDVVLYHHKITPFRGPHAEIVNAVRKADWIDATQATFRNGIPKRRIEQVVSELPINGFYDTLAEMPGRLRGNDVLRIIRELSTLYKP